MKRRTFISLFGGASVWSLVAQAQQTAGHVAHIAYLGLLSSSTIDPRQIEAFKQGLRENGLIEGRNITVDYVWAEGRQDRLRELAEDLVRRNLDIVVSAGPQPVLALMATKTSTPIVFAVVGDAIGNGIVTSLARPEGGVTGLSMSDTDLESKRIEILKETAPGITQLLILHDPTMGSAALAEAEAAARALNVAPHVVETSDPGQFDEKFARAVAGGVNGLSTLASPLLNFHRKKLIELAMHHRLPSIWARLWAEFPRHVPAVGRIRGKNTERRQTGRSPGRAADSLRTSHQPQNCKDAKSDCARDAARPRRRGDRMTRPG
jgi:putative ABC transport system substrate-binding protein